MQLTPTSTMPAAAPPRWTARAVSGALLVASLAAAVVWVLLAVLAAPEGYRTDHVSGVRMALAAEAADGVVYPPLYDGERYGGTRYLPLTIVAHAVLGHLVDDTAAAGRVLGYLSVAGLVAVVVVWLVRAKAPLVLSLGLAATLLVAEPGLGAAFGMRGDGVPAALQVAALGLVAGSGSLVAVAGAAVLAALALSAKLTAVWAAAAIGLWLLLVDRRRLAWFAGVYLAAAAVLLGGFALATDSRMVANIAGLAVAGVEGTGSALGAPNRLLRTVTLDAPVLWALVPVAVAAAAWSRLREPSGLVALALLMQAPLLLFTFTDIGVGVNQLIDLAALAPIAAGLLAVQAGARKVGGLLLGAIVAWVVATAVVTTTAFDLAQALRATPEAEPGLAARVEAAEALLSEDPGVPVRFGRDPVVVDPFMLPRLDQLEPGAVDDLVRRIERNEFDLVVLVVPAEGDDDWWRDYHFGTAVIDAIREHYRPAGTAEGYYLYEPA